jgi:hypothetical protein
MEISRVKRFLDGAAAIITILLSVTAGFCRECAPKLLDKRVVIEKVVFSEYLLLQENQTQKVSDKLDKMDTLNCFEIQMINGKREVGNLVKRQGFGLSKYSFEIGNIGKPLSFDSVAAIVEFRLDIDEPRRNPKDKHARNQAGLGAIAVVCCTLLIIGGLSIILMSGAIFAGGK